MAYGAAIVSLPSYIAYGKGIIKFKFKPWTKHKTESENE